MNFLDYEAVWFYETGTYINSLSKLQTAIVPKSTGLNTAIKLKNGASVKFDEMSALLLNWAKAVIGGCNE